MIIGSFGPWGLGPLWHVAPALTGGLQNLIRAYQVPFGTPFRSSLM